MVPLLKAGGRRTRSGTVILTNSPDGYRAVLPVLESIGADARFVGMLRAQASR